MFDHKHYVPVLRWKRGERVALQKIADKLRPSITPLVELIPYEFSAEKIQKIGGYSSKFAETAKQIADCWGTAPFFSDLWYIYHLIPDVKKISPLQVFAAHCQNEKNCLIPVTGLQRDGFYQAEVRHVTANGVCLRLHRNDLQKESFKKDLLELIEYLRLAPDTVDLLIDFQVVDGKEMTYTNLCEIIPNIKDWRTFTVTSGSFTKDLSSFQKNDEHLLSRKDWLSWRNQVNQRNLLRNPTYSDYTIQHGLFSEPPPVPNFSASIRYTSKEHWIIIRGESVFKDDGPGYAQWPANAQLLCAKSEFCGPDFSFGDKYIYEMGLQTEKTGRAEDWIRSGINHHMTFVVDQVANLAEP